MAFSAELALNAVQAEAYVTANVAERTSGGQARFVGGDWLSENGKLSETAQAPDDRQQLARKSGTGFPIF